ncbi:thiamine phosphate synthase [Lysobacter soyae]|uniref:8-oxo-dGTP diphosphatase n=2 Tax=Lysobacter soyae TaxID=2764185 RepID=A0ABX8WP02_9GAMM|nr:thiamine phosphate synthase [Lysobacter sp. CJ11]
MIHVMAALITDPKGRILMARRLIGRDFAGYWEFPGGKVDPGESPEAALARELKEELGINARIDEAVMLVPQHAPKALKLDVRWVRHWTGTPKGLDGQALAWVPRAKLNQYAVPPPDVPVIAHLLTPDLVWITPALEDVGGWDAWLLELQRVLALEVKRVQLRPWKSASSAPDGAPSPLRGEGLDFPLSISDGEGGANAPGEALLALQFAIALCKSAQADVALNGNLDLALALDCGLHLKSHQLATTDIEAFKSQNLPVSASCHNADELQRAHALGCTYALLGPVARTQSHPNTPPIGWPEFFNIRGHAPALPTYALGGMTPAHIALARSYGAQGIATISGI